MQAITAFTINREAKESIISKLENNRIPIKDIVDRFDRTVFIFRDDATLFIASMHAAMMPGADMQPLELDTLRDIKAAAAPKKEAYSAKQAGIARRRYDSIHDIQVIKRLPNRAGHKGWVTRGEYAQRAAKGHFSHRYVIDYVFHGNRHVETGDCVSFEQARRAMYKKRKMILKKFIGSKLINSRLEVIGQKCLSKSQ